VGAVGELFARTEEALRARAEPYIPPDEVQELRIVSTWLDAHDVDALELEPRPSTSALEGFAQRSGLTELAPSRRMSDSHNAQARSTILIS
jgi:hypothetical protein